MKIAEQQKEGNICHSDPLSCWFFDNRSKKKNLKLLSVHDKMSTLLCDLENPGLLQLIAYSTSKLGKNKDRVEYRLLSRIF